MISLRKRSPLEGDGAAVVAGQPSATAPAPDGPKISARGICREFVGKKSSVAALGPFDLDIEEGEFVCVVGPSGCGKSTFLRIVAGLVNPTAGEVDIQRRRSDRSPVAMVFQDYSIYPWKTVLANVRFGLDMAGIPKNEGTERAKVWLDRVGLSEFANAYPATLSGGMRQRVSIARAMAMEPEILLMDEPFAALDAMLRVILQDELLSMWQADRRTVLFITHSLEEAVLLGDRVVVMSARPGRLLADLPVPFPRPRGPELRTDPDFVAFQGQIWELLSGEVWRAMEEDT